MAPRWPVLVMVVAAILSASQGAPLTRIQVDPATHFMIDEFGRARIFHGVNSVMKSWPFIPDVAAFNPARSLAPEDMALIQSFGFNVVRLGAMWAGVEPEQGQYNESYIESLVGMVNRLGEYGIYTIVDAHQDMFSSAWCGDGAPVWQAESTPQAASFPEPLTDVPRNHSACYDFGVFDFYFTQAVCTAFQTLYNGEGTLQKNFFAYWGKLVQAFNNNPNVLGYELINEPWVGDIYADPKLILDQPYADLTNLQPFYQLLSEQIRAVDNTTVIFYEPVVQNVGPSGFTQVPGGPDYTDRSVLSFHMYCPLYTSYNMTLPDWETCQAYNDVYFQRRTEDMQRLGGSAFLTEFGGVTDTPDAQRELGTIVDMADDYMLSWALWTYKENLNYSGFDGMFWSNGSLQTDKVHILSRPYAPAIAGTPLRYFFDQLTLEFTLVFNVSMSIDAPTELVSPLSWLGTDISLSVSPSVCNAPVQGTPPFISWTPSSKCPDGTTVTLVLGKKSSEKLF